MQLLGSILMIGGTTFLGMCFYMKDLYRKQDFVRLERMLLLIQNQIVYFAFPIEDIFAEVGEKTEGVLGEIIKHASESIQHRKGISLGQIWENSWLTFLKDTYFNTQDIKEIIAFGNTLHFLEKQQQEASFDLLLTYIRQEQAIIQKRLEKNGKLYYSLGILSGLLIVVTLL